MLASLVNLCEYVVCTNKHIDKWYSLTFCRKLGQIKLLLWYLA